MSTRKNLTSYLDSYAPSEPHAISDSAFNSLLENLGRPVERGVPVSRTTFMLALLECQEFLTSTARTTSRLAMIEGKVATVLFASQIPAKKKNIVVQVIGSAKMVAEFDKQRFYDDLLLFFENRLCLVVPHEFEYPVTILRY